MTTALFSAALAAPSILKVFVPAESPHGVRVYTTRSTVAVPGAAGATVSIVKPEAAGRVVVDVLPTASAATICTITAPCTGALVSVWPNVKLVPALASCANVSAGVVVVLTVGVAPSASLTVNATFTVVPRPAVVGAVSGFPAPGVRVTVAALPTTDGAVKSNVSGAVAVVTLPAASVAVTITVVVPSGSAACAV